MIKKLTVQNYQCHKQVALEFAPGTNVISGTSDSGKSALLKALIWVLTNKPSGLSFRHWDREKNDLMSVEIICGEADNTIARRRSEQVNDYLFNDKKYVAMKTDVPSEIQAAHGLTAINIQTQFAPHFLLAQSAGEVAKILNDACDLSIIDRTVKKIKGIAQDSKAAADLAALSISNTEKELSALDWVDDAETRLDLLELEMSRIEQKERQISGLFDMLQDFWALDEKIADIQTQLPFYAPLEEASSALCAYVEADGQAGNLDELLEDLKTVQKKMENIHIVPVPEEAEQAILEEIEQGRISQQAANALWRLIAELDFIENEGGKAEARYKALEKELAAAWKEAEICPLCGTITIYRKKA